MASKVDLYGEESTETVVDFKLTLEEAGEKLEGIALWAKTLALKAILAAEPVIPSVKKLRPALDSAEHLSSILLGKGEIYYERNKLMEKMTPGLKIIVQDHFMGIDGKSFMDAMNEEPEFLIAFKEWLIPIIAEFKKNIANKYESNPLQNKLKTDSTLADALKMCLRGQKVNISLKEADTLINKCTAELAVTADVPHAA